MESFCHFRFTEIDPFAFVSLFFVDYITYSNLSIVDRSGL